MPSPQTSRYGAFIVGDFSTCNFLRIVLKKKKLTLYLPIYKLTTYIVTVIIVFLIRYLYIRGLEL